MHSTEINWGELDNLQKNNFQELFEEIEKKITSASFHRGREIVPIFQMLGHYGIHNIHDSMLLIQYWWSFEKDQENTLKMIIEMSNILWIDVEKIKPTNHALERLREFEKNYKKKCFNPNDQAIIAIQKYHLVMFDFQKTKQH